MERRKELEYQEADIANLGVLLGVIAAAFVTLGVIIYFFGDDQSSSMSAANNPPPQTERMMRNRTAEPGAVPSTIGQGGRSNSQ